MERERKKTPREVKNIQNKTKQNPKKKYKRNENESSEK